MARHRIGSILTIVVLGFGCGSDPSPDTTDATGNHALLRLGAVNLGLNANQPDVRERQDLYLSTKPGTDHSFLVDAIDDIDILCTNEMYTWSREDSYVALVDDLSSVFPYQLKGADASDLSGCGCTEQAWSDYVEPFRECVRENPQRDLLTCFNAPMMVMGHKDPEWSAWRCTRCLTATVLKTYIDYTLPLDEQRAIADAIDFTHCLRDPEPIQCPNCEGKSGVAIHSKYEIIERDTTTFPFSWSSTRGILYAKVLHPSGPIHAFCTHIAESGTAKFTYAGFEHITGSEDENRQHLRWALDYIDSKAIPEDEAILFMGDINIGPGGGDRYVADFPDNFAVFTDAGFVSTVHEDDGPCTECADNPLFVAQNAQWGNPAIPAQSTHIFMRGGPWRIKNGSSANFLADDLTLMSGEVTKWSDKYGMQVDLELD
jgi:hypothetical protein